MNGMLAVSRGAINVCIESWDQRKFEKHTWSRALQVTRNDARVHVDVTWCCGPPAIVTMWTDSIWAWTIHTPIGGS